MKLLGFVVCGFGAALFVSLVAVPIVAWPEVAPLSAYLRPVVVWMPCLALAGGAAAVLAEPRVLVGAPGRALAVVAVLAAFLWPAFAHAQDAATTTVNLGDVFRDLRDVIFWALGLAVAGLVALFSAALKKSTGVNIDAGMQERLKSIAMTGVHLGLDKVEHAADQTTIEVKSKILAVAVDYIRSMGAKETMHFKMTPADIELFARATLQEAMPQRTLVTMPAAITASALDQIRNAAGHVEAVEHFGSTPFSDPRNRRS